MRRLSMLLCLMVIFSLNSSAQKKRIAVLNFDYGTVGYHWWGDYDIGKGMADQVVDALLDEGSFRVVEHPTVATALATGEAFIVRRVPPPLASKAS